MPKGESLYRHYPDYRVDLVPHEETVRVSFGGELIAESSKVLRVEETKHHAVLYFPREDVRFEHLQRTDNETFCPFKGEASYWTIEAGGRRDENAVWSYEDPFEEVEGLRDYVAFYADRVEWS